MTVFLFLGQPHFITEICTVECVLKHGKPIVQPDTDHWKYSSSLRLRHKHVAQRPRICIRKMRKLKNLFLHFKYFNYFTNRHLKSLPVMSDKFYYIILQILVFYKLSFINQKLRYPLIRGSPNI